MDPTNVIGYPLCDRADFDQNPMILIKIPQSHNHKNSHNSGLQEDGEHARRGEGVWSDFRGQGVKSGSWGSRFTDPSELPSQEMMETMLAWPTALTVHISATMSCECR